MYNNHIEMFYKVNFGLLYSSVLVIAGIEFFFLVADVGLGFA